MRAVLVLFVLAALATAGCAKKQDQPASSAPARDAATAAITVAAAPVPFPTGGDGGLVGPAGRVRLLAAASDGAWVAVCEQTAAGERVRVVVGDGPGLTFDRVLAVSPRDLLVVRNLELEHVDVTARTVRVIGDVGPAAIDPGSRRLVYVNGQSLVVRDPGTEPRELPTGGAIGAIWLTGKRWAQFAVGSPQDDLRMPTCNNIPRTPAYFNEVASMDLDPSGVEAADRVGPEVAITPAGEIAVDGEVVVDAACTGTVHAALATPPRVLVICKHGKDVVAGPGGFRVEIRDYAGVTAGDVATISPYLILGQRLPCFSSACVDLWTGTSYAAGSSLVAGSTSLLVRTRDDGGLRIDHLPTTLDGTGRQHTIKLPRLVQAVSVDTVTGRRRTGAAPVTPTFIAAAGRWMLYGRHVVDLQDGVLVATLAEDALAIDELGRVLVPAAPGTGPLTWKKP